VKPVFKITFILVVSVVVGILSYIGLRPTLLDHSALYVTSLSASFAMLVCSVGTAWFFIESFSTFKRELRRAYTRLCIGIVLFGVSQSQLAFVTYTGMTWWVSSGLVTLPYIASAIYIFWGMRSFARLLDIGGRWTSFGWAIVSACIIAVVVAFLPHAPNTALTPVARAMSAAVSTWSLVVIFFATMITWRIKERIGFIYKHSMQALFQGLAAVVIALINFVAVLIVFPSAHWYYEGFVPVIGLFVSTLVLLRAGYVMLPGYNVSITPQELDPDKQLIGAVIYLASLASKAEDIDPVLDTVREITANLETGGKLTEQSSRKLLSVCRQLEDYLVDKEPLRVFTKEQLRESLEQRFNLKDRSHP
jgi:hypothetical protein